MCRYCYQTMIRSYLMYLLTLLASFCSQNLIINAEEAKVAQFPLQFSGSLEIISHLIAADNEYPPNTRRMSIVYDYHNKRARIDIEAGYEAAKYYIRRYDTKNEYMIRLQPIDDCKRSYLGETMPFPDLSSSTYIKDEVIDGIMCSYFLHEDHDIRVHMYLATTDNAPVKLIQESVENGISVPLLTYQFSDVYVGELDQSWFELPEKFPHKECVRHVGGFPYIHLFHYFVRA